jgi:predicted esterase
MANVGAVIMRRLLAWIVGAVIATASSARAQVERYDLGQRLRKMEQAWDAATAENRIKAVEPLKKAVPLFFANKNPEAAAVLDETRFQLEGHGDLGPVERWANSLYLRPAARIVDPADGSLSIRIASCYAVKGDVPRNVRIAFEATVPAGKLDLGEFAIDALPARGTLDVGKLPPGDHVICARVLIDGKPMAKYSVGLSVTPGWKGRLETARKALDSQSLAARDRVADDCRSALALLETIESLGRGDLPETDYPVTRLLCEAENVLTAAAAERPYYGPSHAGQFWLNLPIRHAEIRLFVPEGLQKDRPVPLVVAMHGAGGSENMFFDTYGDGATVKMCKERGWLMVGTRAAGLFDGAPPVRQIVDALAERFPVDRQRVFVMGHSMGATHAMAVVQASPGKFAAAAALGGGGAVRKGDAVKGLPVFVACGSEDFALSGAKSLSRALQKAQAKVTFKEYPAIEHIVIVQAAMKELFEFFEAAGR